MGHMDKKMEIEDKDKKISRIMIEPAENGFIYQIIIEGMEGERHPYVYESVEDILAAIKDDLESLHYRGPMPPKERLEAAFHEMKEDEPAAVSKTRNKFGKEKAKKQLIAIAFSKARGGLFKK